MDVFGCFIPMTMLAAIVLLFALTGQWYNPNLGSTRELDGIQTKLDIFTKEMQTSLNDLQQKLNEKDELITKLQGDLHGIKGDLQDKISDTKVNLQAEIFEIMDTIHETKEDLQEKVHDTNGKLQAEILVTKNNIRETKENLHEEVRDTNDNLQKAIRDIKDNLHKKMNDSKLELEQFINASRSKVQKLIDRQYLRLSGENVMKGPNEWTTFQDSCYIFGDKKETFEVATEACNQLGANLLYIDDEIEYSFVKKQLNYLKGARYWIGLTDNEIEGEWRRTNDNELTNYTNWAPGEPNNYNGAENCVVAIFGQGYLWSDVPCKLLTYYHICKKSECDSIEE